MNSKGIDTSQFKSENSKIQNNNNDDEFDINSIIYRVV